MAQMHLPGMGPPPPVKKVVTAFKGTKDEMSIEITVQAERSRYGRRRWRNRITEMRVLDE